MCFLDQIRKDLSGCEKVNRSVLVRLYPNGIDYAKSVNFAGLLLNVATDKAVEVRLQQINH
ncbi:hypothetical protein KATP_25750 [Kluyvera ascorbata]|nr:hypothetical protein KATP_25750 [Kluyvera ascorbata]